MDKVICIHLNATLDPDERREMFENPLSVMLDPTRAQLDGGGSWMYGASDVWIYTSDVSKTLKIVRALLRDCDVPSGTQIQYTRSGQDFHDEFVNGDWYFARRSIGYDWGMSLAA